MYSLVQFLWNSTLVVSNKRKPSKLNWYLFTPVNLSGQIVTIMVMNNGVLLFKGRRLLESIELLVNFCSCHISKLIYTNGKCVQASLMFSIVYLDELKVFCKDGFPCIMLFGWESRVTYFKENCYLYAILQYKIISHTSWLDPNCLLCVILKLSHSESRRKLALDTPMVKTNKDNASNLIVT